MRLTNAQRKIKIPTGSLRKAARLALSSLGYEDADLSVLITGDRKMRALNRSYRAVDRTTDVLSFSMLEGAGVGTESSLDEPPAGTSESLKDAPPLALGDIVISAPRALVQAGELGHGIEDELIFLLVHGILHLIGYDHEGPRPERLRMERIQRKLIRLIKKR